MCFARLAPNENFLNTKHHNHNIPLNNYNSNTETMASYLLPTNQEQTPMNLKMRCNKKKIKIVI